MAQSQDIPWGKTILGKNMRENSYSFFRKDLGEALYELGDVYNKTKVAAAQDAWDIGSNMPYLKHIKSISPTWPHLRLLADFMEVSTSPLRWGKIGPNEREKRFRKTNVVRLDYLNSGEVVKTSYKRPEELCNALEITERQKERKRARIFHPWRHDPPVLLQDPNTGAWNQESQTGQKDKHDYQLRLYIVEDLSRDVIEAFGEKFDIEPAFFREQIVDYTWCNVRDRWFDPPDLNMNTTGQRWLPLRFVTSRYFRTQDDFKAAIKQSEAWNVFRRPDDDMNNKSRWDDEKSIIGISRERASLWMRDPSDNSKKGAIGVLLLDPTIKAGAPLWYGYRNWEATPSYKDSKVPLPPPRTSFFDDLVYWAQRPDNFSALLANTSSNAHLPVTALLHLICAEWLTMAEYIKTRLNQIEWEISLPEHFLKSGTTILDTLKKLHMWRRLVPLYREMLEETIERVSQLSWLHQTTQVTASNLNVTRSNYTGAIIQPSNPVTDPTSAFNADFLKALSFMKEYQERIDRLTSVVTAVISIEDSRHAQDDNRNIARLTWLGTLFIPLSFIATLFSMQADVGTLNQTYKLYFKIAPPSAVAAVCMLLALPRMQDLVTRKWKRSPFFLSDRAKIKTA